MEQDLEQKLKHIEDKVDAIRKDVRAMRIRMIINTVINILIIVVPLGAIVYFLPTILNNFLSSYLPPDLIGGSQANFQEQLQQAIRELLKR